MERARIRVGRSASGSRSLTIVGMEPDWGHVVAHHPQEVMPPVMLELAMTEVDSEYVARREVYRMRAGYAARPRVLPDSQC